MLTPATTMFEIRVAVIGYVSVGKTTVINALFGNEYGEVAMKRTTAVVNSFRISSSQGGAVVTKDRSADLDQDSEDDSIEVVTKKLSASVTLKETTTDNAAFRNSNVVKEKVFDISLEEPLHKMRPDTKLVIVDVPGINEAGTSSKYKDFVNENWHTFDIVVVVMDARQGVNTEEQHDLLKLVKGNLATSKSVPVIVLSNKVDDPHNHEQKALLGEARAAVEKLFGVDDREKSLSTLLYPSQRKGHFQKFSLVSPAVVPISAMHAFVYRCGARLSFDDFGKMDGDFIDKIGKDSYGRQWHRFGKKKQLEKAFEAVSTEDQRKDGVEASNFDSFMAVLGICIGDEDRQTLLIEAQIGVAVKRMKEARPNCNLGSELLSARNILVVLGKSADHLPAAFWESYERLKTEAFKAFKDNFSPKSFSGPMGQLYNYMKALHSLKWPGEMEEVVRASRELALQYAVIVTESTVMKEKTTSNDQSLILGSMLLCSSETSFNKHFGFLRLHLESKYMSTKSQSSSERAGRGKCAPCNAATTSNTYGIGTEHCVSCGNIYIEQDTVNCPNCLGRTYGNQSLSRKRDGNGNDVATCSYYTCRRTFYICRYTNEMKVSNGKLVPVDEKAYKENVTVVVPESLDDPEHFGHVFWKCCQVLKEADS